MRHTAPELDRQARNVIRALQPVLERWLQAPRLDPSLVGMLYLRTREILRDPNADGKSPDPLVDQLALSVYFTAAAWQFRPPPDPQVLPSLREVIAKGLQFEVAGCEP